MLILPHFRRGVRGRVGQAGRNTPPACGVELSDVAARRCGLVAARLASGRDIPSAGALQNFFRPFDFVGSVGVNGKQDTALLNPALVTLCFVFRNAHADERPGQTTAAHTAPVRPLSDRRQGPGPGREHLPTTRLPGCSGAGACSCSFRRLGVLFRKIRVPCLGNNGSIVEKPPPRFDGR